MIIFFIAAFLLVAEQLNGQLNDGIVTGNRPHMLSQARIFDLPKFAPTARIIKLSSSLRRKHNKEDKSLFSDAAGSFDNFEAFNLEDIDREPSSGEAKTPVRREGSSKRRQRGSHENIGEFFPES
ncbi:hypothetical protein COOONC_21398 [Cooperia oncophora]